MHPPQNLLDLIPPTPRTGGPTASPGKFTGAGVINRTTETAQVPICGYLDSNPMEGHVTVWHRDPPPRSKLDDGRVQHYDRNESSHRLSHTTQVGTIDLPYVVKCPKFVTITMSAGLHQQVREGRYHAYLWHSAIVLVDVRDIEGGRLLVANEREKEVQLAVEVASKWERSLRTDRVRVDISNYALGRRGQRYTNTFVRRMVEQLRGKDLPTALHFHVNPQTDTPEGVRPFGHTVFKTAEIDQEGHVTVEVEVPPQVLGMIRDGKAVLEPQMSLNILKKEGAADGVVPTAMCLPVLHGFKLVETADGSTLDLPGATIILDAPG